jgi:hypothetical protein
MAWEWLRRRFELECSFQVADARDAVLFLLGDEFVSKNPTINRCMTDRFGVRLPAAVGLAAEEELCRVST